MTAKAFGILILALATASASAQQPAGPRRDWSQWRGADRNGSAAFPAPAAWPERLSKQWEVPVGAGHSSPVVAGDRVIVHTRVANDEVVRALELKTGRELWKSQYPAPYTMNPAAAGHGPGPKSTPVVASGRVFTFGIGGTLSAYDTTKGTLLWRHNAPTAPPEFGTAMSPLVDGELVIVHVGARDQGEIIAYEAATGGVRWRTKGDGPGYASPVIATAGGTRQIVTQSENAVIGVEVATGRLLWQIPFKTNFDQNSITPVISNDLVIYSGLENGTRAARIVRKGTEWTAAPVWQNTDVSMYMSSPVVIAGTLYGLSHRNRGQFFAIDLASGHTRWTTPGREGENASIIAADSLLLLSTTNAELIVARPNTARFDEIRRYRTAESAVWAHPAIAANVILVKDVEKLICWQVG